MLRHFNEIFPAEETPNLLVGLASPDDAAVYKLNDEQAIIQTVDFFPPFLDDPYEYGAIAAVNAMNDVYAMGGEVLLALAIAGFPEDMPPETAAKILEGGAAKVREAGAVVAGGHTVIDHEPKYGLCVTGLVHPDRVLTNAGARPGDVLVLTKRLGTGVLISAIQQNAAIPKHAQATVAQMLQLNATAARATRNLAIHAMTDVTGFGLGGHLIEVARASGVQLRVRLSDLPLLDGFRDYVRQGFTTGGQGRNRVHFEDEVLADPTLSNEEAALLFDPQTAGGLVMALEDGDAVVLESRLSAANVPSWRIGEVAEGNGLAVVRAVAR